MIKKIVVLSVLGLFAFITPTFAASMIKYTFNNVDISGEVVEIEVSVRTSKTNPYSTCSYYSDNYVSYLGIYAASVSAGKDANLVLNFCTDHFGEKVL